MRGAKQLASFTLCEGIWVMWVLCDYLIRVELHLMWSIASYVLR
jgi:hypothetical protein